MDRRKFSQEFERVNRRFESQFFPRILKALHSPVKATIEALHTGGINMARQYLNGLNTNPQLTQEVANLYRTVALRHARMNYSRLLKDRGNQKNYSFRMELKRFSFNDVWVDFVNDYLAKFLTEKITWSVTESLRDAMLRAITRGIEEGQSVDQISERIENWPYEHYQAARIVRTETNRAANVGAAAQAKTDTYQQFKEWISAEDSRVRGTFEEHADHRTLNGTKIDENDSFRDSRNGDLLDQPGDPKASAASTINCRCSVAYTYKRDAQGNLIPKRKSTVVIFPGQIRRPQIISLS